LAIIFRLDLFCPHFHQLSFTTAYNWQEGGTCCSNQSDIGSFLVKQKPVVTGDQSQGDFPALATATCFSASHVVSSFDWLTAVFAFAVIG